MDLSDIDIQTLVVGTTWGKVHLALFPKGVKGFHRQVIFQILSEYSGKQVSYSNMLLKENPKVKGSFRPWFPELSFDVNWTHSKDQCLVAYGEAHSLKEDKGLHLGVDMEFYSPKHIKLANRFFAPKEALWLQKQDETTQIKEFYRLWCRKEALYKSAGGAFFEEAVKCSVLENSITYQNKEVHFFDVQWKPSLAIALAVYRS